MRQLLSISMDGPNVNLKFADLLQTEHAELYGAHLVNVGSCGLHTLHNAGKAGFTMWQMDMLLRALHYLFHNVPARREDFTALTGSTSSYYHSVATGGLRIVCYTYCDRIWPEMSVFMWQQ